MKRINIIITVLMIILIGSGNLYSQENINEEKRYRIVKQNGVSFVGTIVSRDAREILIESEELGLVYIPKHEIREIITIEDGVVTDEGGLFGTRYFLTTNGFPVKKGENYVQWNIFGPDFQFGVADHFGLGIMTSWVGLPIVGTAKYSRQLSKNVSGGLGFLGGTGSWAFPQYGLLLPFGFLTYGTRINNINFSGGYGALFTEQNEYNIVNKPTEYSTNSVEQITISEGEGRPLLSLAGMFRINSKFSFVFDSFIMLPGKERVRRYVESRYNEGSMKETYFYREETEKTSSLVVLSPGLRFQANENSSFQFGFTGIRIDNEFVPVPIPMVQWFRKI